MSKGSNAGGPATLWRTLDPTAALAGKPAFTTRQVRQLARDVFGVEGAARPLSSERDQNFLISGRGGENFTLKIANAREDPNALELQNLALQVIAAHDPALPVPRLHASLDGDLMYSFPAARRDWVHPVRLFTYLPGTPVSKLPHTRTLQCATGRMAARLDRALAQVARPPSESDQLWDLKRAADIHQFVRFIDNAEHRRQAERVFERFGRHVLPILPSLRSQVVHGDLNANNILAEPEGPAQVTGVIDFGDMVYSPLVVDVAIAAAHQIYRDADPLAAACVLVGAYHSILPLAEDECEILADLIATRLAVRMTLIAHWDREKAVNRHFDRSDDAAIWRTITLLAAQDRSSVGRRFRDACSQPASS